MSRILVIDDDQKVRMMLRMVLTREGYQVDEASNGRQGLQHFEQKPADLIITDIVMPEMEGLETIGRFREIAPSVKIIAISGGGKMTPDTYLDFAERFGAVCSFTKPVEREDLLSAIEDLLANS